MYRAVLQRFKDGRIGASEFNAAYRAITRRESIRLSLGALVAGLIVGKASTAAPETYDIVRPNNPPKRGQFFNLDELHLLGEVVEVIIPTTDTPGARAANVHGFLDQLMSDWALPETQVEMREVLAGIDADAKRRFDRSFSKLDFQQQSELITAKDAAAFAPQSPSSSSSVSSPKRHPFARFKDLVLLGYYHSEIGATQELQFQLVPGHYEPCIPISQGGRAQVGEIWEQLAYGKMLRL